MIHMPAVVHPFVTMVHGDVDTRVKCDWLDWSMQCDVNVGQSTATRKQTGGTGTFVAAKLHDDEDNANDNNNDAID